MKFVLVLVAAGLLQTAAHREDLNVQEIVGQLGLCNANLVIEQRFVKALQAENSELRKQLEKKALPPVPEGSTK